VDRYYAVAGLREVSDEELAALRARLEASSWRHEGELSLPDRPYRALVVSREFEDLEQAAEAGTQLPEHLGDAFEPDADLSEDALERAAGAAFLIPSEAAADKFRKLGEIFGKGEDGGDDPATRADKPADTPQPPPAPDATKAPANGKPADVPAPAASPSSAELVEKGLQALAAPQPDWAALTAADRPRLAKTVIAELYEERAEYARSVRWLLAQDLELLGFVSDEGKQAKLAESLLLTRAGLAKHQLDLEEQRLAREQQRVKRAEQRVALDVQRVERAVQQVELDKKRVAFAEKGVSMAGELVTQMGTWRSLARWGVGILVLTTLFSMVATALLLYWLGPGNDIEDEWVVIPLIFVLAVFAISPAVLLLLERPLEGIDKWMPGGSAEDDAGDSAAEEDDAATQATPAATTPATESTTPATGSIRPQTKTPV
jgi:hypothetical protein